MTVGARVGRWAALGASALGVLGCGKASIGGDVEGLLTIGQGVYGQTVQVDDVCPGGVCGVVAVSVEMTVTGPSLATAAMARSAGDKGFYELALPTGDFQICVQRAFQPCTTFSVASGTRVRRDLEYGAGGGFWR